MSYADLIERLEKLEGPDREVDALIWCLDHGYRFVRISDDDDYSPAYRDVEPGPQYEAGGHSRVGAGYLLFFDPSPPDHPGRRPGHHHQRMGNWTSYTASLDAAVALVERVLPGWKKQIFENFDGLWIARVTSPRRDTFSTDYMRERVPAGSPNGAIALLISTLKALDQQHD